MTTKPKDSRRENSAPQAGESGVERLSRPVAESLDAVLGVPFRVLDDGFVRVVDYMGTDQSVVQAARVSYGAGTKRIRADRSLIRYLMRHSHTTPFEMCEIKLHVRAPMDVWRQWIRHRTANVNEYSTRYSVAIAAAQRTDPALWRRQSPDNRQGSEGYLPPETGSELSSAEATLQALAKETYERRLALGVAREQARKDLPLSTYTEAYWKIDLHNLLHFLRLRMASFAQVEIRTYATVIGEEIAAKWVPQVWEAFLDFRHSGLELSRVETLVVKALVAGLPEEAEKVALTSGLLNHDSEGNLTASRELSELNSKLAELGLRPPWKRG